MTEFWAIFCIVGYVIMILLTAGFLIGSDMEDLVVISPVWPIIIVAVIIGGFIELGRYIGKSFRKKV